MDPGLRRDEGCLSFLHAVIEKLHDVDISHRFFKDLEIPDPDINLKAGSGAHA
jgi:hypothetical protein